MKKITKNYNLMDFIKVYKGVVSREKCSLIISNSEKFNWRPHSWGDYDDKVPSKVPETEFLRAPISGMSLLLLNSEINNCLDSYTNNNELFFVNGFTPPNLNKYNAGTQMLRHNDHIYSCFDGSIKGIPILSIVGLLNEEFAGGEFVFWDEYNINLSVGDILVFPSSFIYPHGVSLVTEGTRFSFVAWAY